MNSSAILGLVILAVVLGVGIYMLLKVKAIAKVESDKPAAPAYQFSDKFDPFLVEFIHVKGITNSSFAVVVKAIENWQCTESSDLILVARQGNEYSFFATEEALQALDQDPGVISVA